MTARVFPVAYASEVEAVASCEELVGCRRQVQFPPDGEPGYVPNQHSAPDLQASRRYIDDSHE
jgi:hypothetical protein